VDSPDDPHASTPAELKARLEAERAGHPFLLYRDGERRQQIRPLPEPHRPVTIGRRAQNDVALEWDAEVSRLHATVECIAGNWTLADDGLSSNGSFVNGEKVTGRQRLEDRDTIVIGSTVIVFREPGVDGGDSTAPAAMTIRRVDLSDAQRRILTALCRPYRGDDPLAVPATNQAIAEEVFLSVDAVKSHLRALFHKFGIDELRQNQKRARLVVLARRSGVVTERDFENRH
jgi:pSer/pThr/pTyr-binding forkhead associated (FHA) protein